MRSGLLHSSGRSREPGAIRLTSSTLQLCFYCSGAATLSDNCHHYESIRRRSRGFSRVQLKATLHPFRLCRVAPPPPLRRAMFNHRSLERSSRVFERASAFPFSKCVSLVSLSSSRASTSSASDAAPHFQSSASAMARFPPISVKADNRRGKKKEKRAKCAR